LRLTAVNDVAARLGLRPGLALADARAMYPATSVVNADPRADHFLLEAIADWCDRYTPLVGLDPPDGLVLDITGCAHLYEGETALTRDIMRRLALQGLNASVATADTVGCAWAVARYGTTSTVSPGQSRDALLPLPLKALRIAPETDADLAQVGLKRIADVLERPRAPLAARFGENFLRRIDQAVGDEEEPITPRLPLPAVLAERRFADPIALEADILATIEHLAREQKSALERRGEGARLLQLVLFRRDGKVNRLEIGTSAPIRDPQIVRRLFAERLATLGDACDPGFGFDMVRLAALVTERQDDVQTGLAASDPQAELAHLIDRFGARFGLRRIVRLLPQDTHIPEFAIAAVPAHASRHPEARARAYPEVAQSSKNRARASKDANQSSSFEARSLRGLTPQDAGTFQDSLLPPRPIRLFPHPEPIEAIAEVPDGPPVQFTWRRVTYRVAHAEGPERIAMQWWRDAQGKSPTRDYFRIESHEGIRVWLYREGFFRNGTPCRWFLHGLFA
jgi:protein ImuB